MYNLREELFERDADDSEGSESENFLSPGSSLPGSRSTSLSLSNLTSSIVFQDEEISFPSYEDRKSVNRARRPDQVEREPSTDTDSLLPDPSCLPFIKTPMDDTAARLQPSRHVDYLSHEWSEEDIWSSWKHIVSKRKVYGNSARLENASWRTWEKKRRNLRTVNPETVKWLKDHDVTWLYGPLQPGFYILDRSSKSDERSQSRSFHIAHRPHKKPILKKRSLSELMLRKSLSSASFLRKSHDGQSGRSESSSTNDSFLSVSPPLSTPKLTRAYSTAASSTTSARTPPNSNSWKNVRFHEKVEQCIALSHQGEDEPEYHYVSDSDSEVVVMRKLPKRPTKHRSPSLKPKKKNHPSKTIQKLPHAPLKIPEEENQGLGISRLNEPLMALQDEDEENESSKPSLGKNRRRDSVRLFRDKLEGIIADSGPSFPTSELLRTSSSIRPLLESKDGVPDSEQLTFELASFSFHNSTKRSQYHEEENNPDLMDLGPSPGTVTTDNFYPSPGSYSHFDDDEEYDYIEPTKPLSFTSPIPIKFSAEGESSSPRTSSDSGYNSDGTPPIERDSVRDTYKAVTEERGIRDWELYPDAWDELDEAVAWSKEF